MATVAAVHLAPAPPRWCGHCEQLYGGNQWWLVGALTACHLFLPLETLLSMMSRTDRAAHAEARDLRDAVGLLFPQDGLTGACRIYIAIKAAIATRAGSAPSLTLDKRQMGLLLALSVRQLPLASAPPDYGRPLDAAPRARSRDRGAGRLPPLQTPAPRAERRARPRRP